MAFMPNRSTPDYWFEKADQCFRRSRTDSNMRVRLASRGNGFVVKAIELDIKLQKLAKGNDSTFSNAVLITSAGSMSKAALQAE